jgi:hypothetical protein
MRWLEPRSDSGTFFYRSHSRCRTLPRRRLPGGSIRCKDNFHYRLPGSRNRTLSEQSGYGFMAIVHLFRLDPRGRFHLRRHGAARVFDFRMVLLQSRVSDRRSVRGHRGGNHASFSAERMADFELRLGPSF